ncbi:MAG: hypothetical protein ACM3PR_02145 [Bacteroidales bacterium]
MKRITAILGLYIYLFIANQGCRPEHFLITDIRIESATLKDKDDERQFNYYIDTTVFTKDIVFIISYHTDYVAGFNLGFSSECYAFKKGRVYDNQLLEDTYSLKFDHPFVFNRNTIPANQNIFEISSIKNEISIFDNYMAFDNKGADKVIEFSDFFVKNSTFSPDIYKTTFYCKTSDNKEFEKEINVKFSLIK